MKFESLPHEILPDVAIFLTGKEVSTFLLIAVVSSGPFRTKRHGSVTRATVRGCQKRCAAALREMHAPDDLQDLWREQSDAACESPGNWGRLSEYFAFLDYCERTPRKVAQRIEKGNGAPQKPCWIVGVGCLGASQSPVILSTPVWRRELLTLGHEWLNPPTEDWLNPTAESVVGSYCPMHMFEEEEGHLKCLENIAVLSWKDDSFWRYMHKKTDIAAGLIVYHQYKNNCCLDWLPRQTCTSYTNIRSILARSDHSWLLPWTLWDENMLCSFEIDESEIGVDHMDRFGERIISLLNALEEWCAEDGESSSTSSTEHTYG